VFGGEVEVLAGLGGKQVPHRDVRVGLPLGEDDGLALVAVVAGDAQQ
jgi:hypothetical protein